jgi:phosphoribosyl-AMP cyclohydrolase
MAFTDDLKFDDAGLIPAVVQDAENGQVLMVAWMNREAVERTFETGLAHYYSRSRKKLWLKGESSGHTQRVKEARTDCDRDVLLVKVEQESGACHEGYRSCFFRLRTADGETAVDGEKLFDPGEVYGGKS